MITLEDLGISVRYDIPGMVKAVEQFVGGLDADADCGNVEAAILAGSAFSEERKDGLLVLTCRFDAGRARTYLEARESDRLAMKAAEGMERGERFDLPRSEWAMKIEGDALVFVKSAMAMGDGSYCLEWFGARIAPSDSPDDLAGLKDFEGLEFGIKGADVTTG